MFFLAVLILTNALLTPVTVTPLVPMLMVLTTESALVKLAILALLPSLETLLLVAALTWTNALDTAVLIPTQIVLITLVFPTRTDAYATLVIRAMPL